MKPLKSHDEAFADLDAIAFDLLDRPERDAVLAHVDQCETCRAELDERRAVVADLAFTAPLTVENGNGSRTHVRDRLGPRVSADVETRGMKTPLVFPAVTDTKPQEQATTKLRRTALWMAVAAGLFFVASIGLFTTAASQRNQLRVSLKDEALQSIRIGRTADSLSVLLARRDSVIAGLSGRDVSVMTLTAGGAKAPYARMFWDRSRHSWTLLAHNMPALKTGRTYQLWLLTDKAKISAGTFSSQNGEAVVMATYNLADTPKAIAVTEEPTGGVPQPTGAVIVAADATK